MFFNAFAPRWIARGFSGKKSKPLVGKNSRGEVLKIPEVECRMRHVGNELLVGFWHPVFVSKLFFLAISTTDYETKT